MEIISWSSHFSVSSWTYFNSKLVALSIKEVLSLLKFHEGSPECVFILMGILWLIRKLSWVVASVEWITDQVGEILVFFKLLHVNWVLIFCLRLELNSSFVDEILSEAIWAWFATVCIYRRISDVNSIFLVFECESIELEEIKQEFTCGDGVSVPFRRHCRLTSEYSAEFHRYVVLLSRLWINFRVVLVCNADLRRYWLHCLIESWQIDDGIKLVWLDKVSISPTNIIKVAELHLIPCPLFL